MLKRTITYTDFDGRQRTEDHFFNLNKSEIVKWLTTSGDYTLDALLERLSTEKNGKEIMNIFEGLIKMSYGRKSLDGRKFEKGEEIWKDFYETEAYSELFMELVTDAKKAAAFVNQVIPADLASEVAKIVAENPNGIPDTLKDYAVVTPAQPNPPMRV